MTLPKIYIDGILQTWGDKLYGDAHRPTRPRKAGTGLRLPPRCSTQQKKPTKTGPARVRQVLKATTRRAPEVVVKISGGGKGMKAIRAHLDYISRNGEVALENQDGDTLTGRDDIRYLKTELQHGGFGVPEDSTVREAFNIVFSMPPGTEREAVHDSVRAFAADEFGCDFRYVFACHTDEAHPHVHLCVMARSNDGTRLNPRKADLQSWRESFAEQLREHGIEANATRRQARGVTKTPVPQSVTNMQKKRGAVAEQLHSAARGKAGHKRSGAEQHMLQAYEAIARAMSESDDVGDRLLAVEIVNLVKTMPVVQPLYESRQADFSGKTTEPRAGDRLPMRPGGKDGPEGPAR